MRAAPEPSPMMPSWQLWMETSEMVMSSLPAVTRNAAPLPEEPEAFFSSRCETCQWLPPVNWKIARGVDPAPERSRPVASKTGLAPDAPLIVIGACAVPDAVTWHASVYVAASTRTESPGASVTAWKSAHGDL